MNTKIRRYREVLDFFSKKVKQEVKDSPVKANEVEVETVDHVKPISQFHDYEVTKINILI